MANYHKGLWLFLGICYIPAFLLTLFTKNYLFATITFIGGVWTLGQIFDRKEPLKASEYEITDPNKKTKELIRK